MDEHDQELVRGGPTAWTKVLLFSQTDNTWNEPACREHFPETCNIISQLSEVMTTVTVTMLPDGSEPPATGSTG